jgi:hypothetical protein
MRFPGRNLLALTGAQKYYVAVGGNDSASGAVDAPWAITKLATPGAVPPGAIVYLREGWYVGKWVVKQLGTAAKRITITNYPGECVILDRSRNVAAVSGDSNVRFESCEYLDFVEGATGTLRLTNRGVVRDLGASQLRPNGYVIDGNCVDVRLINIRIDNVGNNNHDYGAVGGGIFGALHWCIGWDHTGVRGSGHTYYVQNGPAAELKFFSGCITVNGYAHGVHVFGGSDDKPNKVRCENSILVNQCAPSGEAPKAAEAVAYGDVNYLTTGTEWDGNFFWKRIPNNIPPSGSTLFTGVYDPWPRTYTNGTCVISGNVLVGGWFNGSPFGNDSQSGLTFTGNYAVGGFRPGAPQHPQPVAEAWKEKYATPDMNDDYDDFVAAFPSNDYVPEEGDMVTQARVYANAHEAGRGHVAIGQTDGLTTYAVDLSDICTDGVSYEVFNAENPLAAALDDFVFDAESPNYTFDLTAKGAPAEPIGGAIDTLRRTSNQVGIFLIRKTGATPAEPAAPSPPTRPNYIAPLSPAIWLRGDVDSSIIRSGTNITSWEDQSGNARHYTAYANPQYIANGSPLGDLPAISLVQTSNNYFEGPALTQAQPITIFAVWRPDLDNVGRYRFHHSGASNRCDLYCSAASQARMYSPSAGPILATPLGEWIVTKAQFDGADSEGRVGLATPTTGDAGTNGLSSTALRLSGPAGIGSTMTVVEYVVFFGVLSVGDEANVLDELSTAWSVTF